MKIIVALALIAQVSSYKCSKSTSCNCNDIDLYDITINTGDLTEIVDNQFMHCGTLKNLIMPNVVSIGEMAFAFSGVMDMKAPKLKTIGKNAFRMNVDMRDAQMLEAETIEEAAFFDCTDLTDLNIPKATTIHASAFKHCKSLVKANIPLATNIGKGAFEDCTSLSDVLNPKATIMNYRLYESFSNTAYLKHIQKLRTAHGEHAYELAVLQSKIDEQLPIYVGPDADIRELKRVHGEHAYELAMLQKKIDKLVEVRPDAELRVPSNCAKATVAPVKDGDDYVIHLDKAACGADKRVGEPKISVQYTVETP